MINNVLDDFTSTPEKYLSYSQLVKNAVRDIRPRDSHTHHGIEARINFPYMDPNYSIVFKIDGAKIHTEIAFINLFISEKLLKAYGKTPEEFFYDWKKMHYKK